MRYTSFEIKNFKGIEDIKIDLTKISNNNIFTFVGLNECGKTTVLEAINFFSAGSEKVEPLQVDTYTSANYHNLIPMSKRDNFNGNIVVRATLVPDEADEKQFAKFAKAELGYKSIDNVGQFTIAQTLSFKDSVYTGFVNYWSPDFTVIKPGKRSSVTITSATSKEEWLKLIGELQRLLPRILFCPNFLFDFPDRIYLNKQAQATEKDKFYSLVAQDILDSLDSRTNIADHIVARALSQKPADKKSLQSLLLKMSRHVTEVVFGAWNEIFKRKLDKQIVISCEADTNGIVSLEFNVEDSDGYYLVSDRSLGFRWFFVFFLLTYYRRYRKGVSENVIFLFDEPASNLHPSAQNQLLRTLERIAENSVVMYTTHSHHLVNPLWLEGAFVVKNVGIDYNTEIEEYNAKKTLITVEKYRTFVSKHPNQTSYFQPILDVLDYVPSALEAIPVVVMLEGKYDYYTLNYMKMFLSENCDFGILPCNGADSIMKYIGLYLGWGKDFFVLLDSDKKGINRKNEYLKTFGLDVKDRIFTLADVNANWENLYMEQLFSEVERLEMQTLCYPTALKYSKTEFNRAIQELYLKKTKVTVISQETISNFKNVFTFIKNNLQKEAAVGGIP
jgi:ABC-type cobalamin/Fe3+-siderophores transport system ATPase subunit